jgi:hypothetical protein
VLRRGEDRSAQTSARVLSKRQIAIAILLRRRPTLAESPTAGQSVNRARTTFDVVPQSEIPRDEGVWQPARYDSWGGRAIGVFVAVLVIAALHTGPAPVAGR